MEEKRKKMLFIDAVIRIGAKVAFKDASYWLLHVNRMIGDSTETRFVNSNLL